jgi:Domain of unknown function (DUF4926)
MALQTEESGDTAALLSAVALLRDLPEQGLVRGEVGTIVEALDDATSLVEFSDDRGEAYAIVPCPRGALLVLKDDSPGGVIAGRGRPAQSAKSLDPQRPDPEDRGRPRDLRRARRRRTPGLRDDRAPADGSGILF